MKLFGGFGLLILLSTGAHASTLTGYELLASCGVEPDKTSATYVVGTCDGYVRGVAESLVTGGAICPRRSTTAGQLTSVVVQYLLRNPETRLQPAAQLVAAALAAELPCPHKAH